MKNLFLIVTLICFGTLCYAQGPISISFDMMANNAQCGAGGTTSPVPKGEPSNSDGLELPGQIGLWNSLKVGNADFNTCCTADASITVSGITFAIESGDEYGTSMGINSDSLRETVIYFQDPAGSNGCVISTPSLDWSISGLDPTKTYNLILFGQVFIDGNSTNPADFAINNHNAGNGIGMPVTLDADNDGNFTNVVPNAQGKITGTFTHRAGESFSGWSGIQIMEVFEGLMSISFDMMQNDAKCGAGGINSPVPINEPSNIDGLEMPGQIGLWNSLKVGNADFNTCCTANTSTSIIVNGITFAFKNGDEYGTTMGINSDSLRETAIYFQAANAPTGCAIPTPSLDWSISGLDPTKTYDLILFGQVFVDQNPTNPADFAINNHDAGNGVGMPVTLDSDYDGNFTYVAPNAQGKISGTFAHRPGEPFSGWTGLQLRTSIITFDDAGISAIVSPNGQFCGDEPEFIVTLTNYGNVPLTSTDIIYDIDGTNPDTDNWTGTLLPGASVDYSLGTIPVSGGHHTFNVRTENPNGNTDTNPTNDANSSNFLVIPDGQTITFVDQNATGANDGSSWADAFTKLQDALNSECTNVMEIHVAAGTYYPDEGFGYTDNNRNASFVMLPNVEIYGGFPTGGGARNWTANPTILSGDLMQDDGANFINNSDNSYHVINNDDNGLTATAILDGFTIKAGNANGPGSRQYGGGMFNYYSNPSVTNCSFSGNFADDGGGGMSNENSDPSVINCSFSGNDADDGGGMYSENSNPTVTNCSFSGNFADNDGGGMYNEISDPIVTNCSFSGNFAGKDGGGMFNKNSVPSLTNCSFSGNFADNGGGMYNDDSDPIVTNCILWGNSDEIGGSGNPTVTYSIVEGGYSGTGNQLSDPLFVSQPDFNNAPTNNGDLHLQVSSPAIDTGDDTAPNITDFDLDNNVRIVNANPDLTADIDMGPFEFQTDALPVELVYFKGVVTEEGNELRWQTASEQNNLGFEIQRSTEGRNWKTIDFVEVAGSNTEIQDYRYMDKQAISSLNYYRLKQLDYDGQFEFSNVVALESQSKNVELRLFPNPSYGDLTIANVTGQATIYNTLGQAIMQFEVTTEQFQLDTSALPEGQYLLHIQTENKQFISKQFYKVDF